MTQIKEMGTCNTNREQSKQWIRLICVSVVIIVVVAIEKYISIYPLSWNSPYNALTPFALAIWGFVALWIVRMG